MQTAIEPKRLHLGILPVTVSLLEQMFCLPEGYHIVGVSYDPLNRILNLTLTSDALPETQEGRSLPLLSAWVTQETLPDQSPEYRKITVEVKVV
jgi:hypothetical protein